MPRPVMVPAVPTGLAFELSDLVLLRDWAVSHGVRMVIELDHYGFDGDYEEMIAIFERGSHLRRWLLWRTVDGIIVQPLIGRNVRCFDVTEAIEMLGKPGGQFERP